MTEPLKSLDFNDMQSFYMRQLTSTILYDLQALLSNHSQHEYLHLMLRFQRIFNID